MRFMRYGHLRKLGGAFASTGFFSNRGFTFCDPNGETASRENSAVQSSKFMRLPLEHTLPFMTIASRITMRAAAKELVSKTAGEVLMSAADINSIVTGAGEGNELFRFDVRGLAKLARTRCMHEGSIRADMTSASGQLRCETCRAILPCANTLRLHYWEGSWDAKASPDLHIRCRDRDLKCGTCYAFFAYSCQGERTYFSLSETIDGSGNVKWRHTGQSSELLFRFATKDTDPEQDYRWNCPRLCIPRYPAIRNYPFTLRSGSGYVNPGHFVRGGEGEPVVRAEAWDLFRNLAVDMIEQEDFKEYKASTSDDYQKNGIQ